MFTRIKYSSRSAPSLFCSVFAFAFAAAGDASAQRIEPGEPVLTGVVAPERFVLDDWRSLTMLVTIEMENIDPALEGEISVAVFDRAGKPIEVPVQNTLSVTDIFFGHSQIAVDIGHAVKHRGESRLIYVCARSETIKGNPCAAVDLIGDGDPIEEPNQDAAKLAAKLRQAFPAIGCRCKSATIRHAASDTNHGSLGTFQDGGPKYGNYHHTDATAATVTSIYKFEPHFEIEILNKPEQPDGISTEAWSETEKQFPALCTEGQKINSTTTFFKGAPNEMKRDTEVKTATGVEKFPYLDTTDPAKFTWDDHGYRATGQSMDPGIKGAVKAWDTNIIHWLDSPGIANAAQAKMRAVAPVSRKAQFHAFVHGTTGNEDDNCDCFFGLEYGVVDASGAAGASTVLKQPECK